MTHDRLFVANQNVNQRFAGELLRYIDTGAFVNALVPCHPPERPCDAEAPFAPRGMMRGPGHTLYVANHDGGIVRGPDDLLYVSGTALPAGTSLTGYVLRCNAHSLRADLLPHTYSGADLGLTSNSRLER